MGHKVVKSIDIIWSSNFSPNFEILVRYSALWCLAYRCYQSHTSLPRFSWKTKGNFASNTILHWNNSLEYLTKLIILLTYLICLKPFRKRTVTCFKCKHGDYSVFTSQTKGSNRPTLIIVLLIITRLISSYSRKRSVGARVRD